MDVLSPSLQNCCRALRSLISSSKMVIPWPCVLEKG